MLKIKVLPLTSNTLDSQEEGQMPNEEDQMFEVTGEAGGVPIKLQRVMIQDLNQEFLMDEQGNLYDMEGRFVGKVDEGAEEGEEGEEGGEEAYNEEGEAPDGSMGEALPAIPPLNQRMKQQHETKKKPLM